MSQIQNRRLQTPKKTPLKLLSWETRTEKIGSLILLTVILYGQQTKFEIFGSFHLLAMLFPKLCLWKEAWPLSLKQSFFSSCGYQTAILIWWVPCKANHILHSEARNLLAIAIMLNTLVYDLLTPIIFPWRASECHNNF